jgi:predicted nucleotidyltransferase
VVVREFGLGSLGLAKGDFLQENFVAQLGHEPVRIDILNGIGGVTFEQAWKNRKEIKYDGVKINFIGLEELLILKQVAGRSQDKTDIEKLESPKQKK